MSIIQQTFKSVFGSMQLRCPVCDAALEMSSINQREELALCPACGSLSKLTDLIRADGSIGELVAKPPASCKAARVSEGINVSVSLRSIPKFIGLLWEVVFWNGLLSVFLIGLLAAYYNIFVGPVPKWVPFTNDGVVTINEHPADLQGALIMTLFLTPFAVIGANMILNMLLRIIGKVTVLIEEDDSYAAAGLGPFRWRKRFSTGQVNAIEIVDNYWPTFSNNNKLVKIKSDKGIKLGLHLDQEQMRWLEGVLKILLLPDQADRHSCITIEDRWQRLQKANDDPIASDDIVAHDLSNKETGIASVVQERSQDVAGVRCPACSRSIDAHSINITEGVALCPACGTLSPLSQAIHGGPSSQELIAKPPENCSILPTAQGVEVQISSRSMAKFVLLTLFALFWNGLVCSFGMQSAIEACEQYVGPVPAWIVNIAPNMDADIGGSPLLNLLFLTPFALIGAFLVLATLDGLFGKQSVIVDPSRSFYLTGFKWLNWKKRFDPQQVHSIEIIDTQWKVEKGNNKQIRLEADRTIKFAAFVADDKQRWMVAVLREVLLPQSSSPQSSLAERIASTLNRKETA